MKQISILTVGLATAALAIAPALAEDFTAGKTAAQLFRSDCATCHHSPNGILKQRGDLGELTAFLREHYTTKPDTAAALAAYVSGFAPRSPGRDRTRNRSDTDAPVTTVGVPANANPADEQPPPRRRRTGNAGDVNRRRTHNDGDVPRPPRGIGAARPGAAAPPAAAAPPTSAPPASAATTHVNETQEGDDPTARLRSYLSSGLDSADASAQAGKEAGKQDGRIGTPNDLDRPPATDDTQSDGAAAEPPSQSGTADTAPQ